MPDKVLIVEDDPALLRGLSDNFTLEGYAVSTATDGEAALRHALHSRPDLILLDIMLPKVNGYEICRLLRKNALDTPIIMLTAKGQESDIILGLKLGADDYVTKPFSIKELLARAEAFLRRSRAQHPSSFRFGPFQLDRAARTLSCHPDNPSPHPSHGNAAPLRRIDLTPKEFALLDLLTRRPGRAYARDEILQSVWGHNVFVTTRSVDRAITTLRAKIEPDPDCPRYLHTVRQIGYRFECTT
jgi:DNA-binding response OmpR family regulator